MSSSGYTQLPDDNNGYNPPIVQPAGQVKGQVAQPPQYSNSQQPHNPYQPQPQHYQPQQPQHYQPQQPQHYQPQQPQSQSQYQQAQPVYHQQTGYQSDHHHPAPQPYYQQPQHQPLPQPLSTVIDIRAIDYSNPSPNLSRARFIMDHGFCDCLDDTEAMIFCGLAYFFPQCLFGWNYQNSGQGHFLVGCCCMPFLCGLSRSYIQKLSGATDQGLATNCIIHIFAPCCAIAQESRSLEAIKRHQANPQPPIHQQQLQPPPQQIAM